MPSDNDEEEEEVDDKIPFPQNKAKVSPSKVVVPAGDKDNDKDDDDEGAEFVPGKSKIADSDDENENSGNRRIIKRESKSNFAPIATEEDDIAQLNRLMMSAHTRGQILISGGKRGVISLKDFMIDPITGKLTINIEES